MYTTLELLPIHLLNNGFILYSYFKIFNIYFERKHLKKGVEIGCFFAAYLINLCIVLFQRSGDLNLISLFILMFALTFLYKTKWYLRMLMIVGFTGMGMILDNIFYFLTLSFGLSDTAGIILNSCSLSLTVFWVAMILSRIRTATKAPLLDFLQWLAVLLLPASCIFSMVYLFYRDPEKSGNAMIVVTLIFIVVFVFFLYDRLSKYYTGYYEQQMMGQQLRAYEDSLSLAKENQQQIATVCEDMNTLLSTIIQHSKADSTKELQTLLDSYTEKLAKTDTHASTGNVELDSVINYKLSQAVLIGATLTLNVQLPNGLSFNAFDLNVILGNLLDNAVEGMKKATDKQLWFYLQYDHGVLFIKIENSFDGIVHKETTANKSVYRSRKSEEFHGIGLESVGSVIEKYHGQMEISNTETTFTTEVILYLS